MKLIALTGFPRSGKDEIAKILGAKYGYQRYAFATPLKEAAAILLGRTLDEANGHDYDREQIMPEWGFSMRWFLQRFGTECLRNQIDPNFWLKRMDLELLQLTGIDVKIVITDCRFDNEAATVRNRGGFLMNVIRPGFEGSNHVSDQVLELEEGNDIRIMNDGTVADLADKLDLWHVKGKI